MNPIKAVLFDLDGTLLPLDQDVFIQCYFHLLAKTLSVHFSSERFMQSLMAGVNAMVTNDGAVTNERAFLETFTRVYGEEITDRLPLFDAFYEREFHGAKAVCGYDPKAAETVRRIKAAGFTVALATSPVFPLTATKSRIDWAGLSPEDFALITSYENSHYCKPTEGYYREVATALGVTPEECLMVGNDMVDDMEAEKTGMKVFLLTDNLLNRENRDTTPYPQGGFDALICHLNKLTGREL
ncbi:MAG: HAD family hydrolase [Clostridia bacterium]|nr:HAD family hydrolase [Clostridia bacterium]